MEIAMGVSMIGSLFRWAVRLSVVIGLVVAVYRLYVGLGY